MASVCRIAVFRYVHSVSGKAWRQCAGLLYFVTSIQLVVRHGVCVQDCSILLHAFSKWLSMASVCRIAVFRYVYSVSGTAWRLCAGLKYFVTCIQLVVRHDVCVQDCNILLRAFS